MTPREDAGNKKDDYTPIAWATSEALFEELASRFKSLVVIIEDTHKTDPKLVNTNMRWSCTPATLVGLTSYALERAQSILAPPPFQGFTETQEDDEDDDTDPSSL